jgi:outer membrane protein assembly factor BamB
MCRRFAFLSAGTVLATWLVAPFFLTAAVSPWPQFRGLNGQGLAEDQQPPVEFAPGTNQLWKVDAPTGSSSPIVWGNTLFLTGISSNRLVTLGFDRRTGRELWRKSVEPAQIESVHRFSTAAASTPCTDGENVYAYFGSYGVLAYDFTGHEIWRRLLPPVPSQYGTASSPVVREGTLFLQRDGGGTNASLVALDATTGLTRWEISRVGEGDSYSTPVFWSHNGATHLVVCGGRRVAGYDPADGRLRWEGPGLGAQPISVAITNGDLLITMAKGLSDQPGKSGLPSWEQALAKYDANHDGKIAINEVPEGEGMQIRREVAKEVPGNYVNIRTILSDAVDADHNGVVVESEWHALERSFASSPDFIRAFRLPALSDGPVQAEVAWHEHQGIPEIPSVLRLGDRLLLLRNGGMASILEAATGKRLMDRERLGVEGHFVASPIVAGGRVYAGNESGTIVVFRMDKEIKVLAVNAIGERLVATPAIVDNTIYIRTESHLWAFAIKDQ